MGVPYLPEDVMESLEAIGHKLDRLTDTMKKLRATTAATNERLGVVEQIVKAGYILSEPEVAEVLAQTERATASYPVPYSHQLALAPDAIVFGADMRELPIGVSPADADFPLLSTCVCGRQICCTTKGAAWEYCGA